MNALDARERPILFSAPMVRAILDGRKTQTRRIVDLSRLQIELRRAVRSDLSELFGDKLVAKVGRHRARMNDYGAVSALVGDGKEPLGVKPGEFHFVCPYAEGDTHLGQYGVDDKRWTITPRASRLWVKETFRPDPFGAFYYRATGVAAGVTDHGWKPSIFMTRAASRIDLDVLGVRIERLQDISENDARAEGVDPWTTNTLRMTDPKARGPLFRPAFETLWDEINGDRADWKANPWVWVISFKHVRP